MKIHALVAGAALAITIGTSACGDGDKSAETTASAASSSGGQFCGAMAELIVLLAPSNGPTSPAETKATFTAAAV